MLPDHEPLEVFFLCAAWCGICRDMKPTIDSLEIEGYRLHWVDIEDQWAALEDVEIETFPTIVIADSRGGVRFAGPIEPRLNNLAHLLDGLRLPPGAGKDIELWTSVVANLKSSDADPNTTI